MPTLMRDLTDTAAEITAKQKIWNAAPQQAPKGGKCPVCKKGTYQETSIHDDWDGVLHCDNDECRHRVKNAG